MNLRILGVEIPFEIEVTNNITGITIKTNPEKLTYIKGEELEMIKLDTYQGNVSIKGKIDNLMYTEGGKKSKEGGVFSKLFK